MSKQTKHGTQPNKGTIPLSTERRSNQKLLQNKQFGKSKQASNADCIKNIKHPKKLQYSGAFSVLHL
jgi:hypothetical protein